MIHICPTSELAYDIVNGDTVNLINVNGWRHGKWISEIKTDSTTLVKVKYYNNRQFIKGYIITEYGDTTYYIDETCIETAIPYDLYK